jgi:hypothetical protein
VLIVKESIAFPSPAAQASMPVMYKNLSDRFYYPLCHLVTATGKTRAWFCALPSNLPFVNLN